MPSAARNRAPGVGAAEGRLQVSGRLATSNDRFDALIGLQDERDRLWQPTVASGDGLRPGETYVVTVNSQRYTFTMPSQVIHLVDNLTDVNFVADGS